MQDDIYQDDLEAIKFGMILLQILYLKLQQ